MNQQVKKMTENIKSFSEIWQTMDTYYERPDKNIAEAQKPLVISEHEVADSAVVRDFFLLLRVAIFESKAVGHLKKLINTQTLLSIMGKILAADCEQWAIKRSTWVKVEVAVHLGNLWSRSGRML